MRLQIAAALAIFAPLSASAFTLEQDSSGQSIRWPASFTLYTDGASRDVAKDDVLAAAKRAASHWAAAAANSIDIEPEAAHGTPGYDPSAGAQNKSEIIFIQDDWDYDDSVVATTLVTSDASTHQILDADILVNESQHHFAILPDDSQAGQGLDDDLESALTHEMGHALGLAHNPADDQATMFPSMQRGEVSKRVLSADDVSGVQSLYGAPGDPLEQSVGCTAGVGGDGALALLFVLLLLGGARRRTTAAAVATILVGFAVNARAESPRIEKALRGEVVSTQSFWRAGRIYTAVSVRVETCETGNCEASETYQMAGGVVGQIEQQLGDLHVPANGEKVEVALGRASDGGLRLIARAPSSPAKLAR